MNSNKILISLSKLLLLEALLIWNLTPRSSTYPKIQLNTKFKRYIYSIFPPLLLLLGQLNHPCIRYADLIWAKLWSRSSAAPFLDFFPTCLSFCFNLALKFHTIWEIKLRIPPRGAMRCILIRHRPATHCTDPGDNWPSSSESSFRNLVARFGAGWCVGGGGGATSAFVPSIMKIEVNRGTQSPPPAKGGWWKSK